VANRSYSNHDDAGYLVKQSKQNNQSRRRKPQRDSTYDGGERIHGDTYSRKDKYNNWKHQTTEDWVD
jgi:hypothetical protein